MRHILELGGGRVCEMEGGDGGGADGVRFQN